MNQRPLLACLTVLLFASAGLAQSNPRELTPAQKERIVALIVGARDRGKQVAEELKVNAQRFDEALLGSTVDIAADGRAADAVRASVAETSNVRLQAARQVVHLLTAEQRAYLKAEMAKPTAQGGILEMAATAFHLDIPQP